MVIWVEKALQVEVVREGQEIEACTGGGSD